jgi:hypothetical protein
MSLTKASYSMIQGAPINALDFGMSTTNTAAQNKTALQAAIASSTAGQSIYIPAGRYNIAGEIDFPNYYVQIRGDNTAYGYYPIVGATTGTFGTVLAFTTGAYGFGGLTTDSDFSSLVNIILDGTNTVPIGVQVGGCKQFTNTTMAHFTNIGLWMTTLTNSTIVENCFFSDNGVGIKSAGTAITPFTIRNTNIRRNRVGLTIEGGTLIKVDKCIIESNTYLGLYINCQNNQSLGQVTFDNCWFENNAYVDGPCAVIVTQDTLGDVYNVEFRNCLFDTPNHSDVLFQKGSDHAMYRCRFSLGGVANVTVGAGVERTQFFMCGRGISNGAKAGIADNGNFTYIQDYPFHFLGQNLLQSTNWTNVNYGGFTQTSGKITAANSSGGNVSCTQAIGQTYKDAAYFVWISMSGGAGIGQLPTLTLYAGDGTTVLYTQTATTYPYDFKFRYIETVTGTSGKFVFSNTAACQWYMNYATVVNQTTTNVVDITTW